MTRGAFKQAILLGGNPEGRYDGITEEVKAEVLAEIKAEKG